MTIMNSTCSKYCLLVLATLLAGSISLQAQIEGPPNFIDYQGVVYDGDNSTPLGNNVPTNYKMEFRIYDEESGGTVIWAESQTVTVSQGRFSVRLGAGVEFDGHPHDLLDSFEGSNRYLELTVIPTGQTTGTPILPRLAFQSSPFCFVAKSVVNGVDTISSQTIGGHKTFSSGATIEGGLVVNPPSRIEFIDLGDHKKYGKDGTSDHSGGLQEGRYAIRSGGHVSVSGFIVGTSFLANSDRRIKTDMNLSNSDLDLRILSQLEVTDYVLVTDPELSKKGLIAQEVQKVFPKAVKRSIGVIPDIYSRASLIDGWVEIATDLKKGDKVRLISKDGEGIQEVLEVTESSFRTDFESQNREVFVYGREVDDFLAVDYDSISILNVSATQQLKRDKDREVKELREENSRLRASQLLKTRTTHSSRGWPQSNSA